MLPPEVEACCVQSYYHALKKSCLEELLQCVDKSSHSFYPLSYCNGGWSRSDRNGNYFCSVDWGRATPGYQQYTALDRNMWGNRLTWGPKIKNAHYAALMVPVKRTRLLYRDAWTDEKWKRQKHPLVFI